MTQPLNAIKVLDLTHVLAGPFCTYMLALHGAEVIKIEPPTQPDCVRGRGADTGLNSALMGTNYLTQGANKSGLTLDLKTSEGKAIFLRLVETADVVVENYRADAMTALGLGHEELARLNPRLIYCSLTGFGHSGPRAHVNAYDNVIQAASGIMSMTGPAALTPTKVGPSIVDYAAGLAAALAVSLALLQRDVSGRGCFIDCSMLDTALMMMGTQVTAHYAGATAPSGKGNNSGESGLGCYDASDGKIMLGAFNARQHRRLWTALHRPDFAEHDSWTAMYSHADEMRSVLAREFAPRKVAELEEWLHGLGIPAERVRSIDQALAIAEAQDRPTVGELPIRDSSGQPVRVPLAPFTMSEGGATIRTAPPSFGEHTAKILAELGFDEVAVADLRSRGVV